MSAWWIVFVKELRETLRDRRTLLMMIVVPVLLYPAILIVSEQLLLFGQRKLAERASPVALVGDVPTDLLELARNDDRVRVVQVSGDPERAIRSDSAAAVAVLGGAPGPEGSRSVTLLFDAASDRSRQGRQRLDGLLSAWKDTLLAHRLEARGLSPSFAVPVAVADSSIARPEEVGGYTMGRVLPLLLIFVALLGAFYPAIDLAAGEKERGTLETLLTAPVPARSVVAGKFVTVTLVGVVAAAVNLGSMILTFQAGGLLQMTEAMHLKVSLSAGSVLVVMLTLIPLAVLFGALFLGMAVRSASFKEAQNALTPVYMMVIVPAMLPAFPGIDFGPLLALTPVAGVAFLFRDLMAGDVVAWKAILVVGSTTLYAGAALAFASNAFGSERVLFGAGGGEGEEEASIWSRLIGSPSGARRERGAPSPRAALGFVAAVAVLFFYGGVTLQTRLGERGLLVSEWLLLFVPAVLFVRGGGFDPRRALSLRSPRRLALAGAVLLIAGCMPVAWLIGWLQSFVLPVPWDLLRGLDRLVTAHTMRRMAWLLLLLAVTPALCEEMVFRGVLLGGTRSLTPWRAILLNGLVFGAFHLSFETAIRFLPTAWLGIVIAWAVWRTGSIWVGVLMHFLNNGTILILASVPALRASFSDPKAPPPLWLLPLAGLALIAGVAILNRPNVESETI